MDKSPDKPVDQDVFFNLFTYFKHQKKTLI